MAPGEMAVLDLPVDKLAPDLKKIMVRVEGTHES